jgi:hypothetical protein
MKARITLLTLFLLGAMIVNGHSAMLIDAPPFYSAVETRARIVDEETGQPVDGAVVVAQWRLQGAWSSRYTLHIAEAITGQNGDFVIPEWGPKLRRPLTELRYESPQLIIFKHGYQPLWLQNEALDDVVKYLPNYKNMKTKDLIRNTRWFKGAPHDPVQRSMWNGLNIEIEKFNGTSAKWVSSLEHFLHFIDEEDDRELPQLFEAIALELQRLKANPIGYPEQWGIIDLTSRLKRAGKQVP